MAGDCCLQYLVHPCRKVADREPGKSAGTPPRSGRRNAVTIHTTIPGPEPHRSARSGPDVPGDWRHGPVPPGPRHEIGLTVKQLFGMRKPGHRDRLLIPLRQTADSLGRLGEHPVREMRVPTARGVACRSGMGRAVQSAGYARHTSLAPLYPVMHDHGGAHRQTGSHRQTIGNAVTEALGNPDLWRQCNV